MAASSYEYKHAESGISEEDTGLGGEVHGVREGTGKYEPSEGAAGSGESSTRPVNSTGYLETAHGLMTYSEVAETLAVSVVKAIENIVSTNPDNLNISPEWVCSIHRDIAGSLFPDWAGRLRDINVLVGTHTPPPYYEVPVHIRLYCEDLSARLENVSIEEIEGVAEVLAFADWRFQWVHPFRDFNGRVGRILLSAVLFRLKLPPAETAAVKPSARALYLEALHTADQGNLEPLTEIWEERLSAAAEADE